MLQKKIITQKSFGFTMIELLAVVTIMAILFTIGIVSYTNAVRNARDNRRISDLQNLRQAFVLYRSDNGCYPTVQAYLLTQGYLSDDELPRDPSTNVQYTYDSNNPRITCPSGEDGFSDFYISATMEDGSIEQVFSP